MIGTAEDRECLKRPARAVRRAQLPYVTTSVKIAIDRDLNEGVEFARRHAQLNSTDPCCDGVETIAPLSCSRVT